MTLYLDRRLERKAFDEARAYTKEVKLAQERAAALERQKRSLRGKPTKKSSATQAEFGDLFAPEEVDDE